MNFTTFIIYISLIHHKTSLNSERLFSIMTTINHSSFTAQSHWKHSSITTDKSQLNHIWWSTKILRKKRNLLILHESFHRNIQRMFTPSGKICFMFYYVYIYWGLWNRNFRNRTVPYHTFSGIQNSWNSVRLLKVQQTWPPTAHQFHNVSLVDDANELTFQTNSELFRGVC